MVIHLRNRLENIIEERGLISLKELVNHPEFDDYFRSLSSDDLKVITECHSTIARSFTKFIASKKGKEEK